MAISPQLPAKNAEVKQSHRLAFPVLSDPGNEYARQLSIAFTVPDDLQTIYQGFGISLPDSNGDDSWTLPIPTRIVADAERGVLRVDADPDYTVRPEPEETLATLRARDS